MHGKERGKFEKIPIGKVEKWLVDEAKKAGLDIDGFEHEITNEFVNHVMNGHGNEETEAAQGQIAVKEWDFKKISDLVKSPDYIIVGGKFKSGRSKGKHTLAYAKKFDDGTILYFEEVLDSVNNKSLRGKTMWKRKAITDEQKFFNIFLNSKEIDASKAKSINLAPPVAKSGVNPTIEESGVVANPTMTQGLSTSNIPQSLEKSRAMKGGQGE